MLLMPKCSALSILITANHASPLTRGKHATVVVAIYEKRKIVDKIRIMGLLWLTFKCAQCDYIKDLGANT